MTTLTLGQNAPLAYRPSAAPASTMPQWGPLVRFFWAIFGEAPNTPLTVRSTPDPSPALSQFSAEPHQYSIYAPIVRLGPGRSTLALGINEASVYEWRAWRGLAG